MGAESLVLVGVLLAAPQAPVNVGSLVEQAVAKEAAGDLDGAAELLRKATAQPGASGEAWLVLGRVQAARNELDNAIEALGKARERLQGAALGEALGRLALIEEMRGVATAGQTAEAAAAADAEGPFPLIALSRARAHAREAAEAVALAERAVAAGGGAPAQVAVAFAHEAQGDLAAAEAVYREVLAAQAGRVDASVGLARVLRSSDRAAEAEPLLAQVLEAAPGAIPAYKEAARVQLALHRPARAFEHAQIAAVLAEDDAEAQRLVHEVAIARALEYVRKNQASLAVEELTALRDEHPDLTEARVGLAEALVAQKQVDAALAELRQAVERAPDFAEAQYRLGRLHHVQRRDAASAIGPYEKAVELAPGNLEYRTNLGAALSEAKKYDRAEHELVRVVESPGYDRPEAWIYLGGARLGAGRYRDGIAALDKALAIVPDNAQARAYAAWCYFGLKDAEHFVEQASRAKKLGYAEPNLLDYLGRVQGGEPIK